MKVTIIHVFAGTCIVRAADVMSAKNVPQVKVTAMKVVREKTSKSPSLDAGEPQKAQPNAQARIQSGSTVSAADFASQRFLKLPKEKQRRIQLAAMEEFATNGYSSANTNTIAKVAEISVGSLFKYFANKDALFRHVILLCMQVIESYLQPFLEEEQPFFQFCENLLQVCVVACRKHPEAVALYHVISTSREVGSAVKLVSTLESHAFNLYRRTVAKAQDTGEITTKLQSNYIALFLDDILMNFQFSLIDGYYAERRKLYVGHGDKLDPDESIQQTMTFIIRALSPEEKE